MSTIFKPMLATDAVLDKLRYPLLASPKLDGVRGVVRDGVVYSRSNKPIPNKFVQQQFKDYEHYDGELIVGPTNSKTVYRDTVSHVMSHDKTNFDLAFHVFDHIGSPNRPYSQRHINLSERGNIQIVNQRTIFGPDELLEWEESTLEQGYEGLILRDPNAPYKCGRSTVNEGYLLKLKRFEDAEATVVGFEERMHNGNEATTNELGRTKRSSHAAGKTGRGDLGALTVVMGDCTFNIGTGFTDDERLTIWLNQKHYLSQLVKFKHFTVGAKDAPRHPVFCGFRNPLDLS